MCQCSHVPSKRLIEESKLMLFTLLLFYIVLSVFHSDGAQRELAGCWAYVTI